MTNPTPAEARELMRRRVERRAKDLGAIPDPCNAFRREALLLPTSPLHAANQRWRAAELVTHDYES